MTITIGQLGKEITVAEPSSIQLGGTSTSYAERLAMSGVAVGLSADDWIHLREQFRGLNSTIDESIRPITSSTMPTLNGFYTNFMAQVDPDPGGIANGYLGWTVWADRIIDSAYPLVDSMLLGGYRANNASPAASASAIHAIPAAATDYDGPSTTTPPVTRTADTGLVSLFQRNTSGLATAPVHATWSIPPSAFYAGACRLEILVGTTWRIWTGRQLPANVAGAGWRITNGLIRISAAATPGQVTMEVLNIATWSSPHNIRFIPDLNSVANDMARWTSMAIYRNDPNMIAIRLTGPSKVAGVEQGNRIAIDVVIRRGALCAEYSMSGYAAVFPMYAIVFNSAVSAIAGGGGWQTTAADGLGFYVNTLTPASAVTTSLTAGEIRTGLNPSLGIGYGTPTTTRDEYFNMWSVRDSFVGR